MVIKHWLPRDKVWSNHSCLITSSKYIFFLLVELLNRTNTHRVPHPATSREKWKLFPTRWETFTTDFRAMRDANLFISIFLPQVVLPRKLFLLWPEAFFIYYCITGVQRAVRSRQADRPSDRTYARQSDGVIQCQDRPRTHSTVEAPHPTLSKVIRVSSSVCVWCQNSAGQATCWGLITLRGLQLKRASIHHTRPYRGQRTHTQLVMLTKHTLSKIHKNVYLKHISHSVDF